MTYNIHDQGGKVMVMRSNLRWCSDGLKFTCWNGEVVRVTFIIEAFDRKIISWTAVANAGISGSDIRDTMLEAVEKRFGATRAAHAIEHLSDNGSAYTARRPGCLLKPRPGCLLKPSTWSHASRPTPALHK